MPRVVPSQVVDFIDRALSNAASTDLRMQPNLGRAEAPQVRALAELLAEVPSELFTLGPEAHVQKTLAIAMLREAVQAWGAGQGNYVLGPHGRLGNLGPVAILRQILSTLPDEAPRETTKELAFIDDDEFRQRLREDLGAVERAIANGEWKAATVLAGSVIEALLLWALNRDIERASKAPSAPKSKAISSWDLAGYLRVARELTWISAETYQQASLARGYRNLIHPGREQRLGERCNRATAFGAMAAIDRVAQDIAECSASSAQAR